MTLTGINGVLSGFGVQKSSGSYSDVTNGVGNNTVIFFGNGGGVPFGQVFANGGGSGFALGALSGGDVIGCAVDFTHSESWFRKNRGLWNGNGTADPVGTVNGASISGSIVGGASAVPVLVFDGTSAEAYTANFGAAAFSGSVPSGFTAGWPA